MGFIYFVLLLGGLIFFHELGHFLLARAMGVHVVTFSIGFGPTLFSFKGRKKGPMPPTEYVIAALPLGGFVKMYGDDPSEDVPDYARSVSFNHKAVWRRFLIVAAGPAFNLLLPFFLFFGLGLNVDKTVPSQAGTVAPDSPAHEAGIRPGDRIVEVEGQPITALWELSRVVSSRPEEAVNVVWERDGQRLSADIRPRLETESRVPELGLTEQVARIGIGSDYLLPIVTVAPGSPAAQAGVRTFDQVVAVDGQRIERLDQLEAALRKADGRPATLGLLRPETAPTAGLQVTVAQPVTVTVPPGDGLRGLDSAELVVRNVVAGSPAEKIGLRPGDQILTVNGQKPSSWDHISRAVLANAKKEQTVTWQRDGQTLEAAFTMIEVPFPTQMQPNRKIQVFGAQGGGYTDALPLVDNPRRLTYALDQMWDGTTEAIGDTVASIAGLFRGAVPIDDIGGPLLIGQLAAQTSEFGWEYFFRLMIFLSVNLGLINLLPVPILDGGHILFLALEAVRRRPVSLRTRQIATYLGFAFILVLMVLAFKNDIEKVFFGPTA